jgi:hypothetical protein
LSLRELERSLILSGYAKSRVDFFDSQGDRLAYSSKIKHIMEKRSFTMCLDDGASYHVHNSESYADNIGSQTAAERDVYR